MGRPRGDQTRIAVGGTIGKPGSSKPTFAGDEAGANQGCKVPDTDAGRGRRKAEFGLAKMAEVE